MIEDIKSIYRHKFIEITGISQSLFSEPGQLPQNLDFLAEKKKLQDIWTINRTYGLLLSFRRSFPQKSWITFHLC
jgi:hypothetical protein